MLLILVDVRETVGDRTKRQEFDQCVYIQKHFLTKSDIRNMRVKVDDMVIKLFYQDDSTSVTMMQWRNYGRSPLITHVQDL